MTRVSRCLLVALVLLAAARAVAQRAPSTQAAPPAQVAKERNRVGVRATVAVIDPSADMHDIISELRARHGEARPDGKPHRGATERRIPGAEGRGRQQRPGAAGQHARTVTERAPSSEMRSERREARTVRSERRGETRGTRSRQRSRAFDRDGVH